MVTLHHKGNISDLIGQTEGSIYVEFDRTTEISNRKHLLTLVGDGLTTNSLWLFAENNTNKKSYLSNYN